MSGRWGAGRLERLMGNLLRIGVVVSATVVGGGAVLFLVRHGGELPHYRVFHGEPSDLRSVHGIVVDALGGSARGLVQLGLLLLIATPVARVVLAVIGFLRERDRTYVVITLVVLSVLLFSISGGRI